MKPFTLEWWLRIYGQTSILHCDLAVKAAMSGRVDKMSADAADRAKDFKHWIARRIVRKYGERPE